MNKIGFCIGRFSYNRRLISPLPPNLGSQGFRQYLKDKVTLKALFNEEELAEIKTGHSSLASPLPSQIAVLLDNIKAAGTFDAMYCYVFAFHVELTTIVFNGEIENIASAVVINDKLGGVEVATEKKIDLTKVLNEANVKLPLLLAAQLQRLGNSGDLCNSNLILFIYCELSCGILGLQIQVMVLDSPSGGLIILKKTRSLPFPQHIQQAHACLVPLLAVLYNCRVLLNATASKINHPPQTIELFFITVIVLLLLIVAICLS
ncbi:uncharacterized protein B0P05DRAFT_591460 [Gilbertella persicaria]|uniref:uncharacterized protein n=1 Tax=Gilbertella persicaria TaxID=101096 RepID=UPI002220F4E1|nr:uncharacterized protein B0P05DRAFT_591460 [Gilbertella persicaria]KAI8055604.1 hypothetical protein B0P05DRAFT_591460 [Gilbertella persicaria]